MLEKKLFDEADQELKRKVQGLVNGFAQELLAKLNISYTSWVTVPIPVKDGKLGVKLDTLLGYIKDALFEREKEGSRDRHVQNFMVVVNETEKKIAGLEKAKNEIKDGIADIEKIQSQLNELYGLVEKLKLTKANKNTGGEK